MKLVISDIHHRWRVVKEYLSDKTFDQIIFLGDAFDNFGDTLKEAEETAEYLCSLLELPNFIWVAGNHDLPYIFPKNPYLRCSGNTSEKSKVINEVMGNDIRKFKLYHWDEYYLYTHAGLSPHFLPIQGWSPEWMEKRCQEALIHAEGVIYDPLLSAGLDRGGREVVGGITWCDINEFTCIDGVNQIFGHSIQRGEPLMIMGQNSSNWCIDTNNRHMALINNGNVIIEKL